MAVRDFGSFSMTSFVIRSQSVSDCLVGSYAYLLGFVIMRASTARYADRGGTHALAFYNFQSGDFVVREFDELVCFIPVPQV
jgi:hypothetical protein